MNAKGGKNRGYPEMRDGKGVNSDELFGGGGFAEEDDVAVAVVADQGQLGRVSAPVAKERAGIGHCESLDGGKKQVNASAFCGILREA